MLYGPCAITSPSQQSAQMAQLASMELFQCLYFKNAVGHEAGVAGEASDARDRVEGVVVGIRSNGINIFVPRYVCILWLTIYAMQE